MREVAITEVRPEVLGELQKWAQGLMGEKKEEARESLKGENVQRESAVLVNIEGRPYLIHVVDSEGDVRAADMSLPVNIEHKRINHLVMNPETRSRGELLYDISAV